MAGNVLFLHLESLSQMALWQYAAELEALFGLMGRSAVFSNFQSASTSSFMSLADFMHGDASELDHLEVFPEKAGCLRGRAGNLFLTLRRRGWRTLGVQYGSFPSGGAEKGFLGVWPEDCGQFRWHRDREEAHRETRDFLKKARAAGQPFALYFWSLNTHLLDEDPLRGRDLSYPGHFRAGCRLLDLSVKRLLEDLAGLDLLRDTLIVAFGAHGDDLWGHGHCRGRAHGTAPHAGLTWCPLFIYNNDKDVGVSRKLASMVDLKPTLLRLLLPELEPEKPASFFSGTDLLGGSRGAAFAQSMFALQRERSDPDKAMTKGYAVTDGNYRLVASSGDGFGDDGGLELFLEPWDYAGSRNLLDFCRMDSGGGIAGFGSPDAVHPHYFMTMTPANIGHLTEGYGRLRGLLHAFVRKKEEEAREFLSGAGGQVLPDAVFTRRRNRRSV